MLIFTGLYFIANLFSFSSLFAGKLDNADR